MADPDPMTCDPGSRVYDPDPGTVIPDPIYLVTTLMISNYHYLKQIFSSAHFLIGVQWLGNNYNL